MATIPNVKRFRPFCPTCNDNFTLMVVLPKDTDVMLIWPTRLRVMTIKHLRTPNSRRIKFASVSRNRRKLSNSASFFVFKNFSQKARWLPGLYSLGLLSPVNSHNSPSTRACPGAVATCSPSGWSAGSNHLQCLSRSQSHIRIDIARQSISGPARPSRFGLRQAPDKEPVSDRGWLSSLPAINPVCTSSRRANSVR